MTDERNDNKPPASRQEADQTVDWSGGTPEPRARLLGSGRSEIFLWRGEERIF